MLVLQILITVMHDLCDYTSRGKVLQIEILCETKFEVVIHHKEVFSLSVLASV